VNDPKRKTLLAFCAWLWMYVDDANNTNNNAKQSIPRLINQSLPCLLAPFAGPVRLCLGWVVDCMDKEGTSVAWLRYWQPSTERAPIKFGFGKFTSVPVKRR
jgi:hypothetical protein